MYRKFTADYIFTGYEILSGQPVLITDPTGAIIEIVDQNDAGEEIETYNGLLTPGFINAHCHLELSHLKDFIATNTGLVEFVQQVMTNRNSPNEMKLAAMVNAAAEMYQSGIVAVGDICNTTDSIPVKQQSKLLWHNFVEVSGFVDKAAKQRLDEVKTIFEDFLLTGANQKATLSPHAPYSVSKSLFHLLNTGTANQLITIHNQECAAENDLYFHKNGGFLNLYKNFGIDITSFCATGKSSLQSWLPFFTHHQSIISVHNTFIGESDLDFSQSLAGELNEGLYYCLCINANKYIEQQIPPLNLLRERNCNLILGTDSYASNWQLNILEEIKTIQELTGYSISLPELLQWATINGARALQLNQSLGSFEKGKTPGIVLIENLDNLQTTQQSFARRIL